ncbi:MAG: hypothetical protein LWW81_02315, partial [Rhodocyclales bacterium]|nr:hypothetical protein [Rhodocyclales bacterium]
MAFILRLLTLCLMLNLALPAIAGNGVSKDDLDSQKELLLLKIDGNKEVLQKDLEAQGKRIDAIDKRVDDQVNRFGDLGFFAGLISTLITVVLAAAGLFGYFSVAKKAREEAEEVAETTSKKWFDENHKKLSDRIRELENAATQARSKIDSSVADVATHSKSAIETIQKNMATGTENNQQISAEDVAGLRASDKQLKDKPEANYSFDDWNTRAFAAYQAKQFEDAALFWKRAAEIPNVGAEKTAQTLFNRAVALSDLKRNEEAISTYDQVIDTYHADLAPAIRSFVARAMSNKGVTFTQMGDNDKAITTCSQVIDTYCADPSPAIREVVANSILNKGVAHSHMCDHDKAIATYEQVINTYRTDSAPAIRELVAKAMRNRGNRHSEMDEHDKAIASYGQGINTYRTDPAPAIREQLAKAMFNKG